MKQVFANVGGMRIRYLEAGNAVEKAGFSEDERRDILFIHGLGSSADRWLDIPDAMSLHGFRAVAIDLPGFGLSDKPEGMDYTIGNFVQSVTDFLGQIGMQKASIVGHSLGGYIAAQVAAEHGELVDRLVLIDTSGMLDGPTMLLEQYLEAAMSPTKKSVREVFERLVADPIRIPEVLVDAFIYRMRQAGAMHAFKSAYENSVNTQVGAERLEQIRAPALIVWGRHDMLIPLGHAARFQKSITGSELAIVEDAGHAPFAEKPAIAGELLRSFLIQR